MAGMGQTSAAEGVSIIVPTYQEVKNIPFLLHKIAALHLTNAPFEVLLVDDNSEDGTKEAVEALRSDYPWLRLIIRKNNRSWSQSILQGIQAAQFPLLVFMDADLSHPPEVIPDMLTILNQGEADLVIGSRHIAGGRIDKTWPSYRKMISCLATLVIQPLLPIKIKDPLSGFLAIRKSCYANKGHTWNPIGTKLALEMIVKSNISKIREIPIYFEQRKYGESKLVSSRMAINYLKQICQLWQYKICHGWKHE